MNVEQLNSARLARWSQNGEARLTQEAAAEWLSAIGFCPFLPMRLTGGAPSASFVEAVVGRPASAPSAGERARAAELLVRLVASSAAVPLKLGELPGEQPDYIASPGVLPYLYALCGSRDWKTAPPTTGNGKVSPLAQDCWRGIEQHGPIEVMALQQAIGGEVTETAALRALHELWRGMYVFPLASADGKPAQWDLLSRRFPEQVARGARSGHAEALSALVSLYLTGVAAATEEEILGFLSPVASESKLREVIRGLAAMRQLDMIDVAGRPHVCLLGGLLQEIGEQMSEIQLAASASRHAPKQPWKPRPKIEERVRPKFDPRDVGERRPARSSRSYEPAARRDTIQAGNTPPKRWKKPDAQSKSRGPGLRPPASRFSASRPPGSKPFGSKTFGSKPGNRPNKPKTDYKPWADKKPGANRSGQSPQDAPRGADPRSPRPAGRFGDRSEERPRHAGAAGPRATGPKPFGAKKQFGANKPFGANANKPFGAKRTFGNKPWTKRTAGSGDRPHGDLSSNVSNGSNVSNVSNERPKRWGKSQSSKSEPSTQSRRPGARSFGSKPFRPKPFGTKSFGSRPAGSKPWVKRVSKRGADVEGASIRRNSGPDSRPARSSSVGRKPYGTKPYGTKPKPWVKRDSDADGEGREKRPRRAAGTKSGSLRTGSEGRPKRSAKPADKPAGTSAKKPFWTKNPHGGKGSPRAGRTNRPRGKKK